MEFTVTRMKSNFVLRIFGTLLFMGIACAIAKMFVTDNQALTLIIGGILIEAVTFLITMDVVEKAEKHSDTFREFWGVTTITGIYFYNKVTTTVFSLAWILTLMGIIIEIMP